MVFWMSGVLLKEHCLNGTLQESIGIELVSDVLRRNQLRWWGHVFRKDDEDWVKIYLNFEVNG